MAKKKETKSKFTGKAPADDICAAIQSDAQKALQSCNNDCTQNNNTCQQNCYNITDSNEQTKCFSGCTAEKGDCGGKCLGYATLQLGNAYCGGCSSSTANCCCAQSVINCQKQCDTYYSGTNSASCYRGCGITS